jgi:DNA repair photolyase
MIIREVLAKGILSKSKIYDYVINPYIGCQHSCSYCYARFMKRFSGHPEPWGEFVDVKINAVDLLTHEITRKEPGRVWVSGVCDPYQPLERRYRLTRRCLEILIQSRWPFTVQTRSPLLVRDIDILKQAVNSEVGMSVTTADERMRRLFEPKAPTIVSRIKALDELHRAGIRTFAMIAPLLPGAEGLVGSLTGKVDRVLIDKMNYFYADWVYRQYHLEDKKTPEFFARTSGELCTAFEKQGIECSSLC